MINQMINYSIIIPHKNSPHLLRRCLDSIPSRADIEILIIDDNSDPSMVDFENFPGAERKDVKLFFDKSGRGAGHSRNIGVINAIGKWLIFADADDYFSQNLSILLDKYANDQETDIVFYNYEKVNDTGKTFPMPISIYIENFLKGKFFSEKVLKYSAWSPWSRMIKRNIIIEGNISFEELPFSNDMMFVLNATKLANNIKGEKLIIYNYYCSSNGSLTSKKFYSQEFLNLKFEGALKLRSFYKEVKYPFINPLWRLEHSIGCKAPRKVLDKYHYKKIYSVTDTLLYLFAKLFKII